MKKTLINLSKKRNKIQNNLMIMMIKNKNKYKMLNIIWKHKAIKRINKTRILYLNNKKNKKNKNSKNS